MPSLLGYTDQSSELITKKNDIFSEFQMLRLMRGSLVLNSCTCEYVEAAEHMAIK